MAKTNDILDKGELDKEAQELAAKILREDKSGRIKEVKITQKIKTERTGSGPRPGQNTDNQEDSEIMKNISAGKSAGKKRSAGEKSSGEKADGQAPDRERAGDESGRENPEGGKDPSAGKPGDENGNEESKPEAETAAGEKPDGGEQKGEDDGKSDKGKEGERKSEAEGRKSGQSEEKPESADKGDASDRSQPQPAPGQRQAHLGARPEAGLPTGQAGGVQAGGKDEDKQASAAGLGGGMGGNLDNRLLNNRDQENDAAGELKKRKAAEGAKAETGPSEAGAGEDGASLSLRERLLKARQAMNLKEQAKKKLEEKIAAPAKQGTSKLLQQAWLNLIDSLGLTLIWINIHVFLRWTVSDKIFCKLGEEWLPPQAAQAGGEAAETANKALGLVEVVVLLILDLIILAAVAVILVLIIMIVDFMQAGILKKIDMFIGGLSNLNWSAIKDLYKLFAG